MWLTTMNTMDSLIIVRKVLRFVPLTILRAPRQAAILKVTKAAMYMGRPA
jgi:hypothetical protein